MIRKVSENEFRAMLKEGVVKFQYIKKDGTIRNATGTLKDDLITKKTYGGVCIPKQYGYSVYFDIDAANFRCYDKNKLIGVVED